MKQGLIINKFERPKRIRQKTIVEANNQLNKLAGTGQINKPVYQLTSKLLISRKQWPLNYRANICVHYSVATTLISC